MNNIDKAKGIIVQFAKTKLPTNKAVRFANELDLIVRDNNNVAKCSVDSIASTMLMSLKFQLPINKKHAFMLTGKVFDPETRKDTWQARFYIGYVGAKWILFKSGLFSAVGGEVILKSDRFQMDWVNGLPTPKIELQQKDRMDFKGFQGSYNYALLKGSSTPIVAFQTSEQLIHFSRNNKFLVALHKGRELPAKDQTDKSFLAYSINPKSAIQKLGFFQLLKDCPQMPVDDLDVLRLDSIIEGGGIVEIDKTVKDDISFISKKQKTNTEVKKKLTDVAKSTIGHWSDPQEAPF